MSLFASENPNATDDELFGANGGGNAAPLIDPNKNYLEDLVGEGKKFKDYSALARAKVESDLFIEKLKNENAAMREEVNKRLTYEDLVTRLSSTPPSNPPVNQNNQNGLEHKDSTAALTPEQVEQLLEKRLQEREFRTTAQQNVAHVKEVLTQAYGSNYESELLVQARDLGYSKDELTHLAQTKPKALFRLLGIDSTTSRKVGDPNLPSLAPRGSVDTSRFQGAPQAGTERTKAYYDNLKKSDPKAYWSTSTQAQMHKDALKLGERFFA